MTELNLRRGLLLDRDGVINADSGYIGSRERFAFLDRLFPFLRVVQDNGFRLAILTNQSGVARGKYTEADYEKLTGWMLSELAKEGIGIDLVLACFEHPEGEAAKYRRDSFWRKPNPGMVLDAIQRLRLDAARSAFIGDKLADMQAAKAGGIGKRLLFTAGEGAEGTVAVANFNEALAALLG